LDDLFRVPAETKAAVMHLERHTKQRSGAEAGTERAAPSSERSPNWVGSGGR